MEETQQALEQLSNGDMRPLSELLVHYLPDLRLFVRAQIGAKLRARESNSDLVQSVCREVLGKLENFEYRGEAAFRSWLFRAAAHKVIDRAQYHEAEKRNPAREELPEPVTNPTEPLAFDVGHDFSPSRVAMSKEELTQLEAGLHSLQTDYREAILLAKIVGLSYAEIAEHMNRSPGAARNLVYRGMAQLSLLLEDPEDEAPLDGSIDIQSQ